MQLAAKRLPAVFRRGKQLVEVYPGGDAHDLFRITPLNANGDEGRFVLQAVAREALAGVIALIVDIIN